MPLVYQQNINEHTQLGVWQIAEQEDFFSSAIPLRQEIMHPHKRLQHLAGRYLLKELKPDFPINLIQISASSKPFLPGDNYFFSISHSGSYAAALVSHKIKVGVDIEMPVHKITRIQHKFLTELELLRLQKLSLSFVQQLTLGWSIKEAVFKWHGKKKSAFQKSFTMGSSSAYDVIFLKKSM